MRVLSHFIPVILGLTLLTIPCWAGLVSEGIDAFTKKNYTKAIELFRKALYAPADLKTVEGVRNRYDIVTSTHYLWYAYEKTGQYDQAIEDCTYVIKTFNFNHAVLEAYITKAFFWEKKLKWDKALDAYTEASKYSKSILNKKGQKELSWFLATCPDPKYQNIEKATEIAEKIATETSYVFGKINALELLAAIYAFADNFENAVKTQEKANALTVEKMKKTPRSKSIERLESYKSGKPFHEKPYLN